MNTLKVIEWLGYALLCLAILLALVGLEAAREFQNRPSKLDRFREEGEQIDMLFPGKKAARTAPSTGKYHMEGYLGGIAKILAPRGRVPIAANSQANGIALALSQGVAVFIQTKGKAGIASNDAAGSDLIRSYLKHPFKPRQ